MTMALFVSGPDISNLFIVSIFSSKFSWKLSRLLRPSFANQSTSDLSGTVSVLLLIDISLDDTIRKHGH